MSKCNIKNPPLSHDIIEVANAGDKRAWEMQSAETDIALRLASDLDLPVDAAWCRFRESLRPSPGEK